MPINIWPGMSWLIDSVPMGRFIVSHLFTTELKDGEIQMQTQNWQKDLRDLMAQIEEAALKSKPLPLYKVHLTITLTNHSNANLLRIRNFFMWCGHKRFREKYSLVASENYKPIDITVRPTQTVRRSV